MAQLMKIFKSLPLILVIYLSFISLGLPDSVLGTAWPRLRLSFALPLEYAGLLAGLTTLLSVGASLASPWAMKRWSTGRIVAVCALTTSIAMFGYALAGSWAVIICFTLLFGIGQGAVDTAVNAYMARHYSSRHMNWVHCCWGVGATGGPLVMAAVFGAGLSWRTGYATLGVIQLLLAGVFFAALPLWKDKEPASAQPGRGVDNKLFTPLGRKRFMAVASCGVLFYFLYPGMEFVIGLWGASYLIEVFGVSAAVAGTGLSLFWASLTIGRFTAGVFAGRFSNRALIRGGLALSAGGALLLYVAGSAGVCVLGMAVIGLGLSPLYPTMMHDTPRRLGFGRADRIVGLQVGAALAGSAILPLLFGFIGGRFGLGVLAPLLLGINFLLLLAHEFSARNALAH